MASLLGAMKVEIIGDNSKLDTSIKDSKTKTEGLSKVLKTAFTGVGVAIAAKAVVDLSKELISAGSKAEETRNKFNVVFSEVAGDAQRAANELKASYGQSTESSEKFLSQVGDITTGLGANSAQALQAAETITKLGIDIDSFANLSGGAEQSVAALTGLFTGEREAAKALGIVINDNNLKQYAKDTGLVFEEMTALEKGFLSLELATEQSQLAIGDFARSSDSFANQQKIARAAVDDLKVEIGKNLLPVATKSIESFGKLTGALAEFVAERNKLNEAESAFSEGNADVDQRILLLKDANKQIQRQIDLAKLVFEDESLSHGAIIEDTKEEIRLLESQLAANQHIEAAILMQKDALDKKNEAEAKAAAEIAAAQEAAAKIESDRIAAQIADTQTRIKIQQDLIKEIENVNEEVKAGLIDGNGELEKEQALRVALSELISEGFTVQGQGFKNIIAAAEEFNVVLTDQKEGTEENTEAQDKYYESVDDFYKKLIQESKFGKEAVTKDVDEIELSWESMTDVATDSVSGFFDIFGQLSENRKNVELEAIDEVLQAELAANDLKLGTKIDALNELSDAEVAFNDFTRDAKIKSLEEAGTEESRLELAALLAKEDRIDELEGYEKDYLDAKTKAKEDADEKEKEIKRDAAKRDRLLALFDITIATAAGIAEAIPNWPLVIAAGAAGTVQTGIVLATPVPSFAQGGIVAGNDFVGDHVPAFVNSGEMILNRNQQARLFELANSGGTTNNTSNNSVNINSMFSLGNDAKLNEAAERLFTPLQRVSTRRNASIGGI